MRLDELPLNKPATIAHIGWESLDAGAARRLRALGFDTLVIARPSMIDGDRASLNQPGRPGEGLGLALMRRIKPLIPANYRAIAARDIAQAMVQAMQSAKPGTQVLLSGQMQA